MDDEYIHYTIFSLSRKGAWCSHEDPSQYMPTSPWQLFSNTVSVSLWQQLNARHYKNTISSKQFENRYSVIDWRMFRMPLTFSIKITFLNPVFIIFSHFSSPYALFFCLHEWLPLCWCTLLTLAFILIAYSTQHTLATRDPSRHLPTISFVFVSPAYHTAWHIIDCVKWIKAAMHRFIIYI